MRRLPWTARFDRVVNWSTAFGYFDDTTNRADHGPRTTDHERMIVVADLPS
jgi:hypothetical protein